MPGGVGLSSIPYSTLTTLVTFREISCSLFYMAVVDTGCSLTQKPQRPLLQVLPLTTPVLSEDGMRPELSQLDQGSLLTLEEIELLDV